MILFDLDGTLIDSNGIWEKIDLEFLGRHGLTPTEEYTYTVGHSIFPMAAQFTKDYYQLSMTAQEIMDEWSSQAEGAYFHVEMKPGAATYLARCKEEGQPMAIVTACLPDRCRGALQAHGLEPYFEQLIFAQELGLEKRNPQVYHIAMERLGTTPEDCTFFDDAPENCIAAKTVGITVVGVYDQFYKKYEPEMRRTCDRYIHSFTELL